MKISIRNLSLHLWMIIAREEAELAGFRKFQVTYNRHCILSVMGHFVPRDYSSFVLPVILAPKFFTARSRVVKQSFFQTLGAI